MSARERALYGACHASQRRLEPVRPEVAFQRRRQSPDRLNNSPRRTYDLLRSALVSTSQDMSLVERELTEALSASRNTVRAVLQQLAREGLVTREPKNGTRARGSVLLPIDELSPIKARTLECRLLGCPPIVRDRLRLPVGWTVLMIESLVLENEQPLGLAVSYVALGEDQSADFDVQQPDVILLLEQQLGIRIGRSRTTVGALAADEQTAELVGIDLGAPLIFLEDLIEDDTGQPRALAQLRLRGDRVTFSANAYRSA